MTNEERRERGHRAAMAYEEFVQPALDELRDEYLAALSSLAVKEPWEAAKLTKLAVAQRVINAVDEHIKSLVIDGNEAARKASRAEEIATLPEARRRWLNIAPT